MGRTLVGALVFMLLASTAKAEDLSPAESHRFCWPFLPSDSAELAAAWASPLERLYESIPALSPKEEQWLKEELLAAGNRMRQAMSTLEFNIDGAKKNAGKLLGSIRHLTDQHDRTEQAQSWLAFVLALTASDADRWLARLVEEGVIQRQAIPSHWTASATVGLSLQDTIEEGRKFWAIHVLGCTLPIIVESLAQ